MFNKLCQFNVAMRYDDSGAMMGGVQETRLFVYGTLKRGFSGEVHMQGSRFENCATTRPGYALHDLGPHPALVMDGEGTVTGEVHWVGADHLARLDHYEGTDYARKIIALSDGSYAEAYVMPLELVAGAPRVPGGIWTAKPA